MFIYSVTLTRQTDNYKLINISIINHNRMLAYITPDE